MRWTLKQLVKLDECIKKEMTIEQASTELRISISKIKSACARYDAKFKSDRKDWTVKEIKQLQFCAKNGMTMKEAASDMGIDYQKIRKAASRSGIQFKLDPNKYAHLNASL